MKICKLRCVKTTLVSWVCLDMDMVGGGWVGGLVANWHNRQDHEDNQDCITPVEERERDNQNNRCCITRDGQDRTGAVRKLLVGSVTSRLGFSCQIQLVRRRRKIWWPARTSTSTWSARLEKRKKAIKKKKKTEKRGLKTKNRGRGRCLQEQAGGSQTPILV